MNRSGLKHTIMGLKEKLNELSVLLYSDNGRFDTLLQEIKNQYTSKQDKKDIEMFFIHSCNQVENDIVKIKEEIKIKEQLKEISEIISLSYIAKKYFNKTRTWIYQRINENTVHGKTVKFTDEELDTLRFAIKDISNKLGSLVIG